MAGILFEVSRGLIFAHLSRIPKAYRVVSSGGQNLGVREVKMCIIELVPVSLD